MLFIIKGNTISGFVCVGGAVLWQVENDALRGVKAKSADSCLVIRDLIRDTRHTTGKKKESKRTENRDIIAMKEWAKKKARARARFCTTSK